MCESVVPEGAHWLVGRCFVQVTSLDKISG